MKWLIALVAIVSTSGCSFLFVRGPQDLGTPPRAYPLCTDSMTWPAVDGALGLLFGIGMFSAINQSDEVYMTNNPDKPADDQRAEAAVGLGLFTALAAVSAFVGYQRVSRCSSAREDFARAYPQGQGMPTWGAPQGYPPYPPQQGYSAQPPPQQGYPAQPPPQQGYPAPPPPQQGYPAQPPPRPTYPPTGQPQGIPAGSEGGACLQQRTCNQNLVCASNLCVRPPSAMPPASR